MLKATINTGNIQQNETKQNNEKKKNTGNKKVGVVTPVQFDQITLKSMQWRAINKQGWANDRNDRQPKVIHTT